MKKIIIFMISLVVFTGCTTMKVVQPNPETGLFPTSKQAQIVKSEAIDIDSRKGLVLVPNGTFTKGMVENIAYFDRVINFEDLERIIIQEKLTSEVPSITDRIGVNRAANVYKPFLWLRWDRRQDGNKIYQQLVLTDPLTLDDYFITETLLDAVWAGINDQNNYYPMMNALIDYIRANSSEMRTKTIGNNSASSSTD